MTLKQNFQAAAVRIFDTFESLIVTAYYLGGDAIYTAGGDLTVNETRREIRLLRDTKNLTLTLSSDIPRDSIKYLMITTELPIVPKLRDRIEINGEVKSIVALDADPGDIITILYVG